MKVISIQEYANLIGYKGESPTLEAIQDYAQEVRDWTIWDYPLEEWEYVLNEVHDGSESDLVLVRVGEEVRICEI